VSGSLEAWKQRQRNQISWNAIEMLYTPRQLKHYQQDADLPRSV
jgi:hypothetical protein